MLSKLRHASLLFASVIITGVSLLLPISLGSGSAFAASGPVAPVPVQPPPPTQGSPLVGDFIDHTHIKINGQIYTDAKIDNDLTYDATSCKTSTMHIAGTGAGADLSKGADVTVYSTPGGGNTQCNASVSHVTFTNTNNFDIYFQWTDQGTIQAVDGDSAKTFSYDTASQRFIGQEGGNCHDYMTATVPRDASGNPTSLPNNASLFISHAYGEGWPKTAQANFYPSSFPTNNNGCQYSNSIPVYLSNYATAINTPQGATPADQAAQACAKDGGAFAWALCPIITLSQAFVHKVLTGVLPQLLEVRPLTSDNKLQTVWARMRDLADAFFVLVFLIIILANVFSLNIDAYTIKKVLPRLVVAVLLVQFSYLLAGIIVDFGNVLGAGVQGIVSSVGGVGVSSGPSGIAIALDSVVGVIFAAGAISIIGLPTILLGAALFVLSVLGVIITLLLRQLILSVLIVLAPLAFVAWILPNTENLFKKWLSTFIKLVMMYPLVIFILSISFLLTPVVSAGGGGGNGGTTLAGVIAGFFPLIAFLSIPAAFSLIGGIASKVHGRVSALGRDRLAGSQFHKDIRQGQKYKGLEQAHDMDRNGFGRFMGRAKAGPGFILPTASAKRRLAAGNAEYLKTRGAEVGAQINNLRGGDGNPLQGKELTDVLVSLAEGTDQKGIKADAAGRAQAISMLAQKQGWGELRDLKAGFGDKDKTGQQLLINALQANPETFKRAPDILMPDATAFGNISAEKIVDYDASTLKQLGSYLSQSPITLAPVGASDEERTEQIAKQANTRVAAFNAFREIAASDARRGRMNASAVQAINKVVSVEEDPRAFDSAQSNILKQAYQPDGTIIKPAAATASAQSDS